MARHSMMISTTLLVRHGVLVMHQLCLATQTSQLIRALQSQQMIRDYQTYEGVLPGFDSIVDLTRGYGPWRRFLAANGHDASGGVLHLLSTEHERPADMSVSAFMTNELLSWMGEQSEPWFAHASFIRPHPPYSAAGHFGSMYSPDNVGQPIARAESVPPFHEVMLQIGQHKSTYGCG